MSEIKPPIPENEFERLIKLSEYNIDYSEIRGSIDELTKLAAHVTGTAISQVNLLEANTQWSISNYGIDTFQTPRKDTACQYVIMGDSHLEIEDMQSDERFKDKLYVTGNPNIRYYYGVPLKSDDGQPIGALCVMDTKKNDLTAEQEHLLRIIANEVMSHIEYEHKLNLLREKMENIKEENRKVSHDIRGPIGGIIGLSEILKEQAEENEKGDFLEFANLIYESGKSVLDLANEILSEHQKTDSIAIDDQLSLSLLKQKIENLYKPQAKSKGQKFEVNAEPQADKVVFPKQRILQILGNLITNAIKFTPAGGHVSVNLSLLIKDSSILKAEILDTGVGMSEDKIQEIFSDRAKSSEGTQNERGYGFGFQLAKHLIEEMDGQLEIESKVNKGSKITVLVPLNV